MRRALLLLLAALALGGCPAPASRSDKAHASARGAGNRLNVLLVTIDTLRADHLGAYGYGRATSPKLDALASRGVAVRAGLHLLAEDARQLRRAPDRAARSAERLRQVASRG